MTAKRVIGPFELGERIGVGGMGIVYRALYTKTGTPVAIKILSPDLSNEFSLQKRFEREIVILKKLQHPHIVRYYGGGKIGTQRFYAMELVTGGSLEQYLKEKKRLDWEEAVQFGLHIAQALEHAHNAGIIHRDLKPANLLLTEDRQVKLTDFGIARDTTATALTAAGRTVGTYAYMAPEQIRGKPPVDKKTDLYALGCVLFELLTGDTPFESENQGEMLMQHLQEEPPRVTSLAPNVPIWLEELIFDLLEKEPEKRPWDALAVQVKLEEVLKKVEQQQSILEATAKGEVTRLAGTTQGDLKDLLGKKKKNRKKDKTPIYERAWFLALIFLVFSSSVAGFTYTRMYPSEAALFARVESVTKAGDPGDWGPARADLEQMLIRFPDGRHASQAQDYLDQIEMNLAERQARKRAERGADPENEGERLFLEADAIEKVDRMLALDRYRSMVDLLKQGDQEHDEYRPFVMLAQRQIAKIEAQGTAGFDRIAIVTERLEDAERLMLKDKIKAKQIWDSVINLYAGNRELEQQVAHAKRRQSGDFDGTWPPVEAEQGESSEP